MKSNQKRLIKCVLPPPNVTGSLHVGHALNITLQDIIFRFFKAQGNETLWIPGTDHAGIATQLVSQRTLKEEENKTKDDLGREKFIEYTWSIKERHESSIKDQVNKMNTIINWDHYKFTLDEDIYQAVLTAFCKLYDKGLIYKDKRLVHWDAQLKTALSDLEVINKEVNGKFYYISYKTNTNEVLTIATTRPETLLGDSAVCVNPQDYRYKHLIGAKAIVPIINKEVPIIGDEACEIDKGSGVLKITPAHDFVDFDVMKRFNANAQNTHKLDFIQILDESGKMINVPEKYVGLTVLQAREIIEKDLDDVGLLIKIETIKHAVPFGEKSNNQLEPMLTDQFFVNMKPLAQKALDAVAKGEIKFYPEYFTGIFNHWLENIEPWCISRQLWWGHRIPVWYGPDGQMFVYKTPQEAQDAADKHYNQANTPLTQETDVLDTWFSSALWTFATQGYPNTSQMNTDFLITGKDILFFWVARMIMMSLELCDVIPFKEVYLHGLVLDPKGRKMSKTVGNVLNPLDLIEKYGSDATKLALAGKSLPGKDLKIGMQDVELERNFLTKIKNAAKFCKLYTSSNLNLEKYKMSDISHPWCLLLLTELNQTTEKMIDNLENWNFADSILTLQSFIYNIFCDWFLEVSKYSIKVEKNKEEVEQTMLFAMYGILTLLYPYAPEISSQLCSELFEHNILSTNWRETLIINIKTKESTIVEQRINHAIFVQNTIKQIRSMLKLSFSTNIGLDTTKLDTEDISIIQGLTKCIVSSISDNNDKYINYKTALTYLQLEKPSKEILPGINEKLSKELQNNIKLLQQASARLLDPMFVEHAEEEIVEEMKKRKDQLEILIADQNSLLESLK